MCQHNDIHLRLLAVLSLLLGVGPVIAATPPDFTDVDDILQGHRHVLRNDDLLVVTDQADAGPTSHFKNIMLETSQLKVTKQRTGQVLNPGCGLQKPNGVGREVAINNVIHNRIGRIFALGHDVSVTLTPEAKTSATGCDGNLALRIKDYTDSRNDSVTVVENSGPKWTQLLLADFNQDGYDDVFQNHGNGYAIHTAVDVNDPSKGLKRVHFQGIAAGVVATLSPPVAGDFNGDGVLEVAWLAAEPKDRADIFIYLASVCPQAGLTIRGEVCGRPFSVVPLDTRRFADLAIKTGRKLNWPSSTCSGCSDGGNQDWLAAGNYDGRSSLGSGDRTDELVYAVANNNTLEIHAYRFDAALKPMSSPKKSLFKNFGYNGMILASGPINQFSQTDQLAVVSIAGSVNESTELSVLSFDSALTASKHSLDVKYEAFNKPGRMRAFPFARGLTMGRFDPPVPGSARDFNSQIAVLYNTDDTVTSTRRTVLQIYTVGDASDPKPQFKSERIVAEKRFLPANLMQNLMPLQAGDLRGRSLLLGEPDTFQVESHLQPSVILGSPPQHVDYVTPAKANEPVVFNFSAVKKDFNSTYSVKVSNENQSSNKSTTSTGWALKESASLKGKTTFGPVEVEGELRQSLDVAEKNTVGKTFNTFQSKAFDASTATGFGDQVWYSSRRMNVYIYPVLGRYQCPDNKTSCGDSEKQPMTVVFSGPDNIRSNISATGRTLEWYQPVHVPGQLFTYPWDQHQLLLQNPQLKVLSQTNTGAFFTDDASTTRKINWSGSTGQSQSVGFSSSWKLGGGMSVAVGTPEDTYKKAGGVRGEVNFDMSYSQGLETLNTDSSKIGTSTGIAVQKSAAFPKPANYKFLVEPFVFGNDSKIQQTQNIKPDADILTRGPLQTLFVADPSDAGSGSWWSTSAYKSHIDVGFGFPARWEVVSDKAAGLINKATACIGGECALMDTPDASNLWNSSFYWLRGFYIQANGKGPQRTAARVGDQLQLSVRVYNHSLKNMSAGDQVHVRFYGQPWDPGNNQPVQGSSSFLIGQDSFQSLPGFANNSEPNWRLAHTDFDTSNCGASPCAGQYLVFWAVVWAADTNQQALRAELPGHGLNQNMAPAQLKQLLSAEQLNMQAVFALGAQGLMEQVQTSDQISTSFSNNLGYYHQVFFIHADEQPKLAAKAQASKINQADDRIQGRVNIVDFELSADRITGGEEVALTTQITSQGGGNDALQLLVYAQHESQAEKTLLDQELISYIKANDSYQVRVPIRPTTCGKQQIQVELDAGEPGQTGRLMATETLEVDC